MPRLFTADRRAFHDSRFLPRIFGGGEVSSIIWRVQINAVILGILHPGGSGIIQTFCWPVSLIRVAPMAKLVNQLMAPDCRSLLAFGPMCRACVGGRCCR